MQNIERIPLPTRKDDRGWIITPPVIKDFASADMHIPSLRPQAVRGNHYHEHHSEAVIILGGKCLVATRNRATGIYEEFVYDGIVKELILIPPAVTHAFKNIGYRSIYLICFCSCSCIRSSCSEGATDASVPVSSIADQILT
ncbi:MAG: hypothetical protein AB1847_05350 [bacterium]